MLKRIYAIVSDADFYAFQQRAKKDGMDMGQALAAVTHAYAKGESPLNAKKHADRFNCINAQPPTPIRLKDVEE